MGGNVRHADKGPDVSESTCKDCGNSFTHPVYVGYSFCQNCREDRQENADIKSEVEIVESQNALKVVINIVNQSDVKVNIPLQSSDKDYYDKTALYGVIGYIRVKGDDWRAENVVIEDCAYSKTGVRSNSSRTFEFMIEDNDTVQENKPHHKSVGDIGEDFRDDVKMSRGKIGNSDTVSVLFQPTTESEEHLNRSADSIEV